MNTINKKNLVLFPAFLVFIAGSAFAQDRDVIWESGRNVFVKYAELDDSGFGKNDHPVTLNATEISKALASLTFLPAKRGTSGQEQESIFTDEQIETLSRYLAKGLASARPDQDVIFALEKKVKRLLGTEPRSLYTAGRAFYQAGNLNVIIGNHDRPGDEAFAAAYDPTHMGIVAYDFDHGRRTRSSGALRNAVMAVDGVGGKRVNDTLRNDWLLIDLKSAAESYDVREGERVAEEQQRKREEIKELLAGEDETQADPAAAAPATAARSFEERLTVLDELKQKGLISDEEYAAKRKEILEEL